jgi:AraC-like DNA-binding protein
MGPNLPHGWEILQLDHDKPASCIVIHFYENLISSDFFNIPELEKVQQLLKQAENGIFFQGPLAKKVMKNLKNLVEINGLESYIELLKVFNLLLKNEEREYLSETSFNSVSFVKDQHQINKVYEYVFQNLQEGVQLKAAADLLNMASGSFCRYFKKKTKLTFMQYVKNVRIGLAAKMLVETDKQITQICYESGYNNLANFNHYFKGIMKMSPSEYRKSFR